MYRLAAMSQFGTFRISREVRPESAMRIKADTFRGRPRVGESGRLTARLIHRKFWFLSGCSLQLRIFA
jgi:hypothetical protein